MRVIIIIVILTLAGCAPAEVRTEIIYKPVEVKMVVPTPCFTREQIPLEPIYELDNKDLAGKGLYEIGVASLKEIEQRKAWQREARFLLESCITP